MLQGHVVRLVLAPAFKQTSGWDIHELIHGITGPAFLFGSGFAFVVAAQRRRDVLRSFTPGFWRRFAKSFLLILIGYALAVPFYSLSRTLAETTPSQWQTFFRFDILQLIGFSLLLQRILYVFIRTDRSFVTQLLACTIIIPIVSPILWSSPVIEQVPRIPATWLTGVFGSPFPITPYMSFLTAGGVCSWYFLEALTMKNVAVFMRHLLVGGSLLVTLSLSGALGFFPDAVAVIQPQASATHFIFRIGAILMTLPACWFIVHLVDGVSARPPHLLRWVTTLGRESLFVYVAHLLLLYGSMFGVGRNVQGWFGASMGIIPSILMFVGIAFLVVIATIGWHTLKTSRPRSMRVISVTIPLAWIAGFVLSR